MSLISVIVPVYNVEPFLNRCVDSILAQTFTNFELILVDDGSPDNCGTICDEYAAKDHRIHVIHQKNGGLSAARNAGIDWAFANSDSQWLSFIDSDDWVHPCYLEYLYRAAQETGAKVSACKLERVEGVKAYSTPLFFPKTLNWEQFYTRDWDNGVVAVNKLYSKCLFQNLRYPLNRLYEDEFLTYKLLDIARNVSCVDEVLYYYYSNPKSITKRSFSMRTLDGAIALKQQCRYARRHKAELFYYNRMQARMKKLVSYLKSCEGSTLLSDKDRTRASRFLRSELRKVLISEGRTIAPFRQNHWLYEIAFPKVSWLYWCFIGVYNKIKRMVK